MPSSRRKPGSRRAIGLGPGFHRGDVKSVRDRLLSLHGIGPETADSILLYAGGYPAFVVDAYTRRIGRRMGLFKANEYDQIQTFFQTALHPSPLLPLPSQRGEGGGEGSRPLVKLYNEFHALIVRLAKEVCTKREPKCEMCPVKGDCQFGLKTSPRRKSGPSRRSGSRLSPG